MSETATQPKQDKMAIVLYSGTVDNLMAAGILASGGAALGMEVNIFVTFWGLMALKKGAHKDPAQQRVSKEFEEFAPAMMQAMQEKNVKSWVDMIRDAQEIGDVNVYACGMTLDLFGLGIDDLEDVVRGVKGVTGFVSEASESATTLFI